MCEGRSESHMNGNEAETQRTAYDIAERFLAMEKRARLQSFQSNCYVANGCDDTADVPSPVSSRLMDDTPGCSHWDSTAVGWQWTRSREGRPCLEPPRHAALACPLCVSRGDTAGSRNGDHREDEEWDVPSVNISHHCGVAAVAFLRCTRCSGGCVGVDTLTLLRWAVCPSPSSNVLMNVDLMSLALQRRLEERWRRVRRYVTVAESTWIERSQAASRLAATVASLTGCCILPCAMATDDDDEPASNIDSTRDALMLWVRWFRFSLLWCAKEAVLKAIGCGLGLVSPAAVEVIVSADIEDVDDARLFMSHRAVAATVQLPLPSDLPTEAGSPQTSVSLSPSLVLHVSHRGTPSAAFTAVAVVPSYATTVCSHATHVFRTPHIAAMSSDQHFLMSPHVQVMHVDDVLSCSCV